MTVHPSAVPARRAAAGSPATERCSADRRSLGDGHPGAHSPAQQFAIEEINREGCNP